jgi:hypothetical protein
MIGAAIASSSDDDSIALSLAQIPDLGPERSYLALRSANFTVFFSRIYSFILGSGIRFT